MRKYYRQDFTARLRTHVRAGASRARGNFPRGQRLGSREFGDKRAIRRAGAAAPSPARRAATRHLCRRQPAARREPAASRPSHRDAAREALILQAALNYPWLLHDHLEEFASLEFRHADAEKLKGALIDISAHAAAADAEAARPKAPRAALRRARRPGSRLAPHRRSITTQSVWGARPEAAPEDVLVTWRQLVALHRQWHSLTRELKDAEQALGQDNSEANYSRLRDVKAPAVQVEGTEALIEGFGALPVGALGSLGMPGRIARKTGPGFG